MTRIPHPASSYDLPARMLHWLTAGAILMLFGLGIAASNWPMDTGEAFAVKSTLFSAHKTLGITTLVLAVLRILWALVSPHPQPLASHGAGVRRLSGIVHWALYVALLLVPLTGWLHHASSVGFAPIWWPLGQTLPLLPQDPGLSAAFGAMHWLATKILAILVFAHIGGALLHHWRDRDVTLLRMTRAAAPAAATAPRGGVLPRALPALVLWAAVLALALALPRGMPVAETVLGTGRGAWVVEQGEIAFTVTQTRQPVRGRFTRWSADIAFEPVPVAGQHGTVRVEIDVTSLALGAVTVEALAPEFFDAGSHPLAVFEAEILPGDDDGFLAQGTLVLKGAQQPVTLPFTLQLDGETARMAGRVTLDRRDFVIGPSYRDEATVGFEVGVEISLQATRRPAE